MGNREEDRDFICFNLSMKYPRLILLLFIITLVLVWKFRKPENNQGKQAPEFTAQLQDGSEFSLSDLRGKYVLLDFWGSWCPPCRRDNPNLVELYDQYNSRGFEIVSVAIEKNEKTWSKAISKDRLDWPYHILRTSRMVATDALALKYQVSDLPSKFLIDPRGQIIGTNLNKAETMGILDKNLK